MDLDQLVDKTANKENEMKVSEALETLKKYNKWRRGKGKKSAQPGFPADLTPELIGQAIDRAILTMKHRIPREDFLVLDTLVAECVKNRKAAKVSARLPSTLPTDEHRGTTEEPPRRDCGRLASRLRHHS